jgi:hypothetical protein
MATRRRTTKPARKAVRGRKAPGGRTSRGTTKR